MANSSYLCSSDEASLYPSGFVEGFDPATGVVAHDVSGIPLLWLAMFRPADLVTGTFTVDPDDTDDGEGVVVATAPLAAKDRALTRLDAALPVLNRLFAAEGAVDAHAALLRQAIEKAPGAHVTIELEEIEGLWEEGAFQPALRAALACLDGETDPAADRARLISLSGLRPGRPFPSARLLVDDLEAEDDDYWNLVRLLGASLVAEVPWETAAPTG
ncbi:MULTISPECIES: hypothetical protein [unclassified Streptomyces]|uniref:hypothetical protein n=1 Tax=unclassified Streptomyces TaxID=2593676 RepID=UPI0016617D0D|nr:MULTISPECIES: hypothetical protein [unclassified Streptomyces]MBD0710905.1 hypothetical protein [Streptomyces sp. CBMA291]MBD0717324.1 hypothetical protein [Streptomyces sp. CBMA370]